MKSQVEAVLGDELKLTTGAAYLVPAHWYNYRHLGGNKLAFSISMPETWKTWYSPTSASANTCIYVYM